MLDSQYLKRLLILGVFAYLFFFLGNSVLTLTDPDETFYTLTAREMAIKGEWLTPYIFNQPQFEKPIFTYWLLRAAIEQWGETPFSMRFFPALLATFGVWAVYALGLIGFKNERKAFWSALALCTGALYVGMGKTVFTDMVFTVFILYALFAFYLGYVSPRYKILGTLGFYLFAGLAVLTKGPLGLFIPQAVVVLFLLYQRQLRFLWSWWTVCGLLLCLTVALPWYLLMFNKYGDAFIQEFFVNDHWRRLLEAEHKGNDHWYFYPLTMLMGMFPWTLFCAAAFVDIYKRLKGKVAAFEYFIISWLLVVFFVFQPAHSKLASYILPLFPALALLTGGYIEGQLSALKGHVIRVFSIIMAAAMVVLAVGALAAFPYYQKYVPSIMPGYFCAGALITLAGAVIVLMLKDRMTGVLIAVSLTALPVLWTAFLVSGELQPHISSFDAAQYLPHYPGVRSTILCSKPYARGVRYYTGQDVAVVDINGSNYFSPHPIPILSTKEQLSQFLKRQPLTYAVVKKGAYEDIARLPSSEFKVRIIRTFGRSSIVAVQPISH